MDPLLHLWNSIEIESPEMVLFMRPISREHVAAHMMIDEPKAAVYSWARSNLLHPTKAAGRTCSESSYDEKGSTTVKPLKKGHIGDKRFVLCREVVPSSEVAKLMYN